MRKNSNFYAFTKCSKTSHLFLVSAEIAILLRSKSFRRATVHLRANDREGPKCYNVRQMEFSFAVDFLRKQEVASTQSVSKEVVWQ